MTARNFYQTWEEVKAATEALGIATVDDYGRRHVEDPSLPEDPSTELDSEWDEHGGWDGLFKKRKDGG